jgi:hypothetical protein
MKRFWLAGAVAAFVVTVGGVASAEEKGTAGLAGEIKTETGEAVTRGMINILFPGKVGMFQQVKTDDKGKWQVTGLPKGEWRAMFLAEGYATQIVKTAVKDGEQVTMPPVVMKKMQ